MPLGGRPLVGNSPVTCLQWKNQKPVQGLIVKWGLQITQDFERGPVAVAGSARAKVKRHYPDINNLQDIVEGTRRQTGAFWPGRRGRIIRAGVTTPEDWHHRLHRRGTGKGWLENLEHDYNLNISLFQGFLL